MIIDTALHVVTTVALLTVQLKPKGSQKAVIFINSAAKISHHTKLELLHRTIVNLRNTVVCDVTPCSLVEIYLLSEEP
jgi:hypothetical protein